MEQQVVEPGDEVEIIESVNEDIIGKKYRVVQCYGSDVILADVNGHSDYDIALRKVKLTRKTKDFILWSKPPIQGANCNKCSKFSEYQISNFICFECKNV